MEGGAHMSHIVRDDCHACGMALPEADDAVRCPICDAFYWIEGGRWWLNPGTALPPFLECISPGRGSKDALIICTGLWTEDGDGRATSREYGLRVREVDAGCEIYRFNGRSGRPNWTSGLATMAENLVDRARRRAGQVPYILTFRTSF
jgi:hypothetical protein